MPAWIKCNIACAIWWVHTRLMVNGMLKMHVRHISMYYCGVNYFVKGSTMYYYYVLTIRSMYTRGKSLLESWDIRFSSRLTATLNLCLIYFKIT